VTPLQERAHDARSIGIPGGRERASGLTGSDDADANLCGVLPWLIQDSSHLVHQRVRRERFLQKFRICLAQSPVLKLMSLSFFLLFAPLFLATFILSIVAIARRRIAAGVILMVAVLAIPPVVGVCMIAQR